MLHCIALAASLGSFSAQAKLIDVNIRNEDRSAALVDRGYHVIKLKKTIHGIYYTSVNFYDRELVMMIDSGCSTDFLFNESGMKKLRGYYMISEKGRQHPTINGMGLFDAGYVCNVNFPGTGFDVNHRFQCVSNDRADLPDSVFHTVTGKVENIHFDGVIGNYFFKKFSAVTLHEQDTLNIIPFLSKEIPLIQGKWLLTHEEGVDVRQQRKEMVISNDTSFTLDSKNYQLSGKIYLRFEFYDNIFTMTDIDGAEQVLGGGFYRRTGRDDMELLFIRAANKELGDALYEIPHSAFQVKNKGKFTHFKFKRSPPAVKK